MRSGNVSKSTSITYKERNENAQVHLNKNLSRTDCGNSKNNLSLFLFSQWSACIWSFVNLELCQLGVRSTSKTGKPSKPADTERTVRGGKPPKLGLPPSLPPTCLPGGRTPPSSHQRRTGATYTWDDRANSQQHNITFKIY